MRGRALAVDALLAAGTFAVMTAAMTANVGQERQPDALAYVWALGLGALMFVRRQHAVLALVVTAVGIIGYHAAGYPAVGIAVPVAAALFSAAEAGAVRIAVAASAALLAVATGYRVYDGQDLAYLFGFDLPLTASVMGAAIALGDGAASRRLLRHEQEQRLREAEVVHRRELTQRVEQERLALARDLHDVLAHTVAVISVQSDVAAEACANDDREAAAAALRTIRSVSGQAMHDLRSTVELLRAPTGEAPRDPVSGLDDLPLLATAAQASGLQVSVAVEGEPRPIPPSVDTTAYRILQEALTNTIRHAKASTADVRISYRPDALSIEVSDDGRSQPVPPTRGHGHGLRGMRERVAVIGGNFEAGAAPDGAGFRVSARLPIPAS